MGGSVATPQPSNAGEIAALSLQSQNQRDALNARAQMLLSASQIAPQQAFPDIWGSSGAYNIAKNTAELNAANSQALQKVVDPQGYQIAQNTKTTIQNLTDPATLAKLSNQQFAQHTLPGMYGTGMQTGSQAFGSQLFKNNTLENAQLMQQLAGFGTQYGNANPAPQVGLNPGMAASAPIQAQVQAANQGNAFLQGILGQGSSLQQSQEQANNSLTSNLGMLASQQYVNDANQIQAEQSGMGSILGKIGSIGGGLIGTYFGGPVGGAAGAAAGSQLSRI